MNAIVYTSNTGHTKAYAEMIGSRLGLPVFDLSSAEKKLMKNAEIVYLGWLMGGTVKGYKKASRLFTVKAVCGVGMSGGDGQLNDIRKTNKLPEDLPVFCLQGGYEPQKLTGIYRFMMKIAAKALGKGLAEKQDRTPEEDELLDMMKNGKNTVSEEKLNAFFEWYKGPGSR